MWWIKRHWQRLQIQLWLSPRQKESLFLRHKEVLKRNTIVIIVESEGTLGQIATSFKHWRMWIFKSQEDKEKAMETQATKSARRRTRYEWCDEDDWHHHLLFGQLHFKVWESWLKYPILKGYHPKCMCRVGEEGYSCISIITCPCINSFDRMRHCWLFAYFTF